MSKEAYVVKLGTVMSVNDNMDGGRIKVKLTEDKATTIADLPDAFPLNPKMFHCVPKVGEGVLVITSQLGNGMSQRYYIGPVISQPQDFKYGKYYSNMDNSISLLQGGEVGPYKPISNWAKTIGAFPQKNDIALIGRQSEDIILRDGEIDLRCGIRKEAFGDEDTSLKGWVIFNDANPAYIQLRHKKQMAPNCDSVVNVVADKINLISHQAAHKTPLLNPNDSTLQPLLKDYDLYDLMGELHQLPYGDKLVEVLTIMCRAITEHVHAMSTIPPLGKTIEDVKALDLNEILSKHVRIS